MTQNEGFGSYIILLLVTALWIRTYFLVIVSIPLLGNINTFKIFNIFSMPVPVKDPIIPTNKLPNMVAWCRIETSLITVNLAQMKYVLLTATEQEHCTSSLWHYCDVTTPVYSMISSKLCTLALFIKDRENVQNYCKTKLEPNSILPKVYHVTDGLWFRATLNTVTFTVVFPQKKGDSDCKLAL